MIETKTKTGNIVIKLRNDIAPKHAERIKLLAREKFYDNVPFHRVIDGFMAQAGDGQRGNGNLRPHMRDWRILQYQWLRIQSPEDPAFWVTLKA